MRFFLTWAARLLLLTRWLDAAQRPAKFFNFPLIGEFLALGNFDQFENLVQQVNGLSQRFDNFRGVRHSLADG